MNLKKKQSVDNHRILCRFANAKCQCPLAGDSAGQTPAGSEFDPETCHRHRMSKKLWRASAMFVPFAMIAGLSLQLASPVAGQTFTWDVTTPFALAPTGRFGAAVVPEFDRRTLDGQLVYQRRAALRMGWTPHDQMAFWGEGGIASLQLFSGSRILQGAYGPAVGAGWCYLWREPIWRGMTPFASGRFTYLQSKLSDDIHEGSNVQSRRSRFEWLEYSGIAGVARHYDWGDLQAGLCFRLLNQDEIRNFRNGGSLAESRLNYSSGLQPGLALGGQVQLSHRLIFWLMAESSLNTQKVTLAFGQWGSP